MRIWLDGKSKRVLLFDIDEDALMLANARLQWWVEGRKEKTGKKPTNQAQAAWLKKEYKKILKGK